MEPKTQSTEEKILEQLIELNKRNAKINSVRGIFYTGIIYGVGFFLGSVVVATIAFGALAPWIGEIDWIRENFEKGSNYKQAATIKNISL